MLPDDDNHCQPLYTPIRATHTHTNPATRCLLCPADGRWPSDPQQQRAVQDPRASPRTQARLVARAGHQQLAALSGSACGQSSPVGASSRSTRSSSTPDVPIHRAGGLRSSSCRRIELAPRSRRRAQLPSASNACAREVQVVRGDGARGGLRRAPEATGTLTAVALVPPLGSCKPRFKISFLVPLLPPRWRSPRGAGNRVERSSLTSGRTSSFHPRPQDTHTSFATSNTTSGQLRRHDHVRVSCGPAKQHCETSTVGQTGRTLQCEALR